MSPSRGAPSKERVEAYWNSIAPKYASAIRISLDDFHYGPLVPGDSKLGLLPADLKGARCLELGCGRAQNSICLAKRGALCEAGDISQAQLDGAAKLALEEGVALKTTRGAMEDMPEDSGPFDLIHSAYALDFCENPGAALRKCAKTLKPDGRLVFSVGHPLLSGEWVSFAKDDGGLLLRDYFHPSPDVRTDKAGKETVRATFRPLSETFELLRAAGFAVERLLEPQAPEIPKKASVEELDALLPYWSRGWLAKAGELAKIPVVAIFKCRLA